MTMLLTTEYTLAPATAPAVPIATLDDRSIVLGCFDTDDTPFCVETTIADWQIGAGSDGFMEIEHSSLDLHLGVDVAQLPAFCAQIRALDALLESGMVERIDAIVRAWDAGELMPLPS